MAKNPRVAWTFWAPKPQIQVNVSGSARWLAEQPAKELLLTKPQHSRKAYATLSAPGHPQTTADSGLPENWDDRSLAETNYAAKNFGVLVTDMSSMEILKLSRDGHQRLLGTIDSAKEWHLDWLIP